MIRTALTRGIFILLASFFVIGTASAQKSTKSNKKNKTEKTAEIKEEEKQEETVEEKEYFWSYTIMEVIRVNDGIKINVDKKALSGNIKMAKGDMELAHKAAAGALTFSSELEFLQFMSNQEYEFISAVDSRTKEGQGTKMYFRKKLER